MGVSVHQGSTRGRPENLDLCSDKAGPEIPRVFLLTNQCGDDGITFNLEREVMNVPSVSHTVRFLVGSLTCVRWLGCLSPYRDTGSLHTELSLC